MLKFLSLDSQKFACVCMYYDGGVVTKQTFIYSQHSSSNNNNNNTTTTMTVERGYSVSLIRRLEVRFWSDYLCLVI
uniref:CSON014943 protein n=1 Tax=Culicoides sonorensis TaxID=179676 RepID=A0A336MG61_CULSO